MELTLPPELTDGLVKNQSQWDAIVAELVGDTKLWGRVTRLLQGAPAADDLLPVQWPPPADAFENRTFEPGTKVLASPDGPGGGYFFEWGQCVIRGGGPGDCWTPPPSPTGYEPFHQGDAPLDDGVLAKVGTIGVGGHATAHASLAAAMQHYGDPLLAKMIATAHEDDVGGFVRTWFLPSATYADLALVQACALSGDWRWREQMWTQQGQLTSGYDCLGPCMVARPGLPLTRQTQYASGEIRNNYTAGGSEIVVASAAGDGQVKLASCYQGTVTVFNGRQTTKEEDNMTDLAKGFEIVDGKVVPVTAGAGCDGGCAKKKKGGTCENCSGPPTTTADGEGGGEDGSEGGGSEGAPVTRAEFDQLLEIVSNLSSQLDELETSGSDAGPELE